MRRSAVLRWACPVLCIVLPHAAIVAAHASAAFCGYVADSATSLPVAGARVSLDRDPPDGTPERVVTTTTFGFFKVSGLSNASYHVLIEHPSYQSSSNSVTFSSGGTVRQKFALTPNGTNSFDIYVQVSGVTTGLQLKDVPVAALLFTNAADATPTSTFTAATDTNGFLVFRGMQSGFYRFRVNDVADGTPLAFWEPYSTEGTALDKQLLQQPYMANALLKPIPQDMTVQVNGYNPILNHFGGLEKTYVELTGIDPRNGTSELVPTRTGVTDTNGMVEFTGLPAIPWRVTAKRLGYSITNLMVQPDAAGNLPATVTIDPFVMLFNQLHVTLRADGYDTNQLLLLFNVPLRIQGLKDSGTEGVDLTVQQFSSYSANQRTTFDVLPGRYRMSVEGASVSNTFFQVHPYFSGEDYIEVAPGESKDIEFHVQPRPATIHGQLFAADGRAAIPTKFGEREPLYESRKQTGIEFTEYATDHLLETNSRVVSADSDETGTFATQLLPARYGIRIGSMSNYWGEKMVVHDLTDGTAFEQGWPFAEQWPYAGLPPSNGTTNHGNPLVFKSNHDYQVDVYVRTQKVSVVTSIGSSDGDYPGQYLALAIPNASPTGKGGPVVEFSDLEVLSPYIALNSASGMRVTNSDSAAFADVTPGFYSLTATAGLHSVTGQYSGTDTENFQVPDWKAPGVVPDTDPMNIEPLTDYAAAFFSATYQKRASTLALEEYSWNGSQYDLVTTNPPANRISRYDNIPIAFVRPDYSGGKIFRAPYAMPGLGPYFTDIPMPPGAFDYWIYLSADHWFHGSVSDGGSYTQQIYIDGPNNNVGPTQPPSPSYDLQLHAIAKDDPAYDVPNTTINLAGTTVQITNQTLVDYTNGPTDYSNLANPNWEVLYATVGIVDLTRPTLSLTAFCQRGTAVRGNITDTNAAPLPNATITVRTHFGAVLKSVTNAPDGSFSFPSALPSAQTMFVDVTVPGYQLWRQRFTPDDTQPDNGDPTNRVLIIDAALEPLPQPQITSVNFDRFGPFLPGARRAGNQSVYGAFSAAPALTATWTVEVQQTAFDKTQVPFDNPDGSPAGSFTQTVTDRVDSVWLIDPRSYPTNRQNDAPIATAPANSTNAMALLQWLAQIRSGEITNVFYQRVSTFTPGTNTNTVVASGQVQLWTQPPGDFIPVFIIQTRRGAVVLKNDFAFQPGEQLHGIRLPPWLSAVSDVLGTVAGAATASEQLNAFPNGRFLPLPDFTADIEVTSNSFLDYDYGLSVDWEEGMEMPNSGLLKLASKDLGLNFTGTLNCGLHGEQDQVFLGAGADIASEPVDASHFLPGWARSSADLSGSFHVSASTTAAQNFDPASPYEFELTNYVAGGFNMDAGVDLRPITSAIPYVGPVLLTLDESGALQIKAVLDGGAGLESTTHWRTLFPPARYTGSTTDPDPHVLRRHFLGGTEGIPMQDDQFDLCFHFGAGLEVTALGGAVGAKGKLNLQGNDCAGDPSVVIEPNTFGDWPAVKRVSGNITASLDAYLDLWIAKVGKSWEWELISFDHRFGTEPDFQLIPLNITRQMIVPANAPTQTFNTNGPAVIDDFFSPGSAIMAGSGGCGLLFTDTGGAAGMMRLRIALQDGDHWRTPVTIASAAGILNSDLLRRSNSWLAVWTEIDAADVGNPFPASTIKWSESDASGNVWSTPQTVAALDDAATQLKLVPVAGTVGLVFQHTADGPLAGAWSLATTLRNGNNWSAADEILTNAPLAALDAAGNGVVAAIAYAELPDVLNTIRWDGTNASAPQTLLTNAERTVSLNSAATGGFVLAASTSDDAIALFQSSDATNWNTLGTPVTNVFPTELQVSTPDTNLNLLVWTEGANPNDIVYAFCDATGVLVGGPLTLTTTTEGNYRGLQLCVDSPTHSELLSRYESSTVSQVVSYSIPFGQVTLENPQLNGNKLQFFLRATRAGDYRVEWSSNLTNWTELQTLSVTNQPVLILDAVTNGLQRFYRARAQ